MKKKSDERFEDELRPEYDFSAMRIVARGPNRKGPKVVTLDPDVARAFPDDESVNEALRVIANAGKRQVSLARKNASKKRAATLQGPKQRGHGFRRN